MVSECWVIERRIMPHGWGTQKHLYKAFVYDTGVQAKWYPLLLGRGSITERAQIVPNRKKGWLIIIHLVKYDCADAVN